MASAVGIAVVATGASGAVQRLRLDFSPQDLQIGGRLTLSVRSDLHGPVQLVVHKPGGVFRKVRLIHVAPLLWQGQTTLDRSGKWLFRATQGKQWATLTLRIGPTSTNGVFGPLGANGCLPPSPRNQVGAPALHAEVLGTATRGRFWGLFSPLPAGASWASADDARFVGLVGKEMNVLFKFERFPKTFYAVAPDGTQHLPSSGPKIDRSSNWHRRGIEWRAGFLFDQAGCWQIHAADGQASGDLWLDAMP